MDWQLTLFAIAPIVGLASGADPMLFHISEIGYGPQGFIELDSQFVYENLAIYNNNDLNMNNYKLVIAKMKPYHEDHYRKVTVRAVIALDGMVMTKDQFLVIEMNQNNNFVSSSRNVLTNQNTRFNAGVNNDNLLEFVDSETHIMMLINGDYLYYDGHLRPLKVEDLNQMKSTIMVDALVYGGTRSEKSYKVLPILTSEKRKMPTRHGRVAFHTFSKCSIRYSSFESMPFRDTNPTVAQKNDCGYLSYDQPQQQQQIQDQDLDQLDQFDQLAHLVTQMDEFSLDIAREVEIPAAPEGEVAFERDPYISQSNGNLDLYLRREYSRRLRLTSAFRNYFNEHLSDHTYSNFEWQQQFLSIADILAMETYQADVWPMNFLRRELRWVEFLLNKDDPKLSRVRCGLCHKWSKQANIREQEMDKISKAEGINYNDRNRNLQAFRDHERGAQHQTIRKWLKELAQKEIKFDDYPLMVMSNRPGYRSDPTNDEYTVTARMMRTVYLGMIMHSQCNKPC